MMEVTQTRHFRRDKSSTAPSPVDLKVVIIIIIIIIFIVVFSFLFFLFSLGLCVDSAHLFLLNILFFKVLNQYSFAIYDPGKAGK